MHDDYRDNNIFYERIAKYFAAAVVVIVVFGTAYHNKINRKVNVVDPFTLYGF